MQSAIQVTAVSLFNLTKKNVLIIEDKLNQYCQ